MKKLLLFATLLFAFAAQPTTAQTEKQKTDSIETAKAKARIGDGKTIYVGPATPVPTVKAAPAPAPNAEARAGGVSDWIAANWLLVVTAILGIWEVIARLTPSEKDNTILGWVKRLLDAILPNAKTGGGTHP